MALAAARKTRTNDPYNLEARLEKLIHEHLKDMEEHPEMYASKDRLATIQYVSGHLNRKYGWGEDDNANAGSAVRRYSGAFRIAKPEDATRTRATTARSTSLARIPADTQSDDDSEDAAA